MSLDFHIIIPARYQSTRFPGKLLMDIGGQTVIERTYSQALKAEARSIVIATDHDSLVDEAKSIDAPVIRTAPEHPNGSDRLAEVVSQGPYAPDDIIVNVQGDEPFIEPALIRQVAHMLQESSAPVATLCWPIETEEQLYNPNVVKVVRDQGNQALYFSRQAIPFCRDKPGSIQHVFRHIGLYAYRAQFLLEYVQWPPSPLEELEALEQLRILEAGHKIRVDVACLRPMQDINTEEDLLAARKLLEHV